MEIILFLTMMVMIAICFSGYLYRVALVQSSRVDLIFTRFENMCFKNYRHRFRNTCQLKHMSNIFQHLMDLWVKANEKRRGQRLNAVT